MHWITGSAQMAQFIFISRIFFKWRAGEYKVG